MLSLFLLAIVLIFVPLYPYIATYAIVVRHTFRSMQLEPADPAQMPNEITNVFKLV
jgi:hypothetical protein